MAPTSTQLMTRSSYISRQFLVSNRRLPRSHYRPIASTLHTKALNSRPQPISLQSLPSLRCRDFSSRTSPWKVTRSIPGTQHQLQTMRSASSEISKSSSSSVESERSTKERQASLPPSKAQPAPILSQLNPLSPKSKESREYIWTVPNILTFSRLALTPVIGYTILTLQPYLALGLFAYAGITDLVDGYIARRYKQQTVLGTVIDPMADKALMTTVVVCTTLQGFLPVWLAVVILGRDVALAISAIYFRYISLPPPKTFVRYWDFSLPSAEVRPTEISKINTLLQLLLVGNAMVLPALPQTLVDTWNLVGVFEGWQYLVATTTVWSGLSYIWSKDAVKILSVEEAKAKEAAMVKQKEKEAQ